MFVPVVRFRSRSADVRALGGQHHRGHGGNPQPGTEEIDTVLRAVEREAARHARGDEQHEGPERQVDPEDPPPVQGVNEEPAQEGSGDAAAAYVAVEKPMYRPRSRGGMTSPTLGG